MLTRRDLEDILGYKLTDEEWDKALRSMEDIADKMWEEDHPLDD
jgi:hypothetical protein